MELRSPLDLIRISPARHVNFDTAWTGEVIPPKRQTGWTNRLAALVFQVNPARDASPRSIGDGEDQRSCMTDLCQEHVGGRPKAEKPHTAYPTIPSRVTNSPSHSRRARPGTDRFHERHDGRQVAFWQPDDRSASTPVPRIPARRGTDSATSRVAGRKHHLSFPITPIRRLCLVELQTINVSPCREERCWY